MLLTDEERDRVLQEFDVPLNKLPMILNSDPAIQHLDAKEGDMIKIIRDSQTNKKTMFYRAVVHG